MSKQQAQSFVQEVADQCDRIVWRGRVYHLPVSSQSDVEYAVELPDSPERYCSGCGGEVEDVATHKCRVEVLTERRNEEKS